MTENSLDPAAVAFADHLTGMDERQRTAAWKLVRGLVLAQLPDDEVDQPPVRSVGEFLDTEIEVPPMLVHEGMVARGGVHAMIAKAGKGKTAVSLNRFVNWAAGMPFLPQLDDVLYPEQPLRTLLIENEGSGWHFQSILRKMIEAEGRTDEQRRAARDHLFVWGEGGWSGMKLDDPAQIGRLRRACEVYRPDILFLEPMRGLWKGNENDSGEMANMIDALSELANFYELAVMLTHHERKSGPGEGGDPMDAARGSAVLVDLCAVVERWLPAAGGQQRELTWAKSRFNEPPAPIRLQWVPQRWGYEFVSDAHIERRVAQALANAGNALDIASIMEETDEPRRKVSDALNTLIDEGRVRKIAQPGRSLYAYNNPDDDYDTGLEV
jgi:hypothetical protein